MQKIVKPVGTREEGTLGNIAFVQFDTIAEAVEQYGELTVIGLFNRALSQDMERVARENLKKEKETEETTQALIDNYRPGNRTAKPTMKNFQAMVAEFAEAEKVDEVLSAHRIYKAEGLEAAYNYLVEQKTSGALAA